MSGTILPQAVETFVDANGKPLAGGSVYMYIPNTTTFKNTYQDPNLTILNTNPIILNASGQAIIWGTGQYRQQVFDQFNNLIWDQITEDANTALTGFITDNTYTSGVNFTPGVTTSLTITANPVSVTNMWVFFDGVYQTDSNIQSISYPTVTFTSPIPVGVTTVTIKIGTTISIGTPNPGTVNDASVAQPSKIFNRIKDFFDLRDFGAVCDGVTDDTAAVQGAISTIGSTSASLIIPGPTLISSNLTFNPNTQLWPLNGGYLIGKAGTELVQLQSVPIAGPVELLLNMAARATIGMTVYPEWFGAKGDGSTDDKSAIQSAISFLVNTGGIVQFDAHTYILSSNVNIGISSAGSAGQNTVLQGKGRNSTILRTTSSTTTAIQVLGAAGTALQGISIREMTIDKNVTGAGGVGIALQYTAGVTLYNIQINNYLLGVSYLRATNTIADKVTVTFSGTTNNWHGFDLNGGGTGAGGNASSVFRDCYVQGLGPMGTGVIGFYAYGSYVSDYMFLACETASLPIGYEFDMSASVNTGNEDVQLINCRADGCTVYGVYVNAAGSSGSADSMVTILGGWYDMGNVTSQVNLIYLNGCQGVTVQSAQIYNAPAEANAYGVYMQGCQGCSILGNTFRELKYGVFATGGRGNMLQGNNCYNSSATPGTVQLNMMGEIDGSIQGNIFRGFSTNGANIDATSQSCSMLSNIADPSNITTRYNNSAGGTSFTANNIGA